jgi:lysophospholipase L1-like esterase
MLAETAAEYHAPAILFPKVFADACRRMPTDCRFRDGVHPTCSGQQSMADGWVRAVDPFRQKESRNQRGDPVLNYPEC